jgi:murein L,D-transpeptidase YcbB/YkuD
MIGLIALLCACTSKTIVIENPGEELSLNNDSESVVLGKTSEVENEEVKKYITSWLDTINIAKYVTSEPLQDPIRKELKRFYNFNRYQLAWSTLDAPNSESKDLLNALAEAEEHGLNPDDYRLRKLVYDLQQVYSRRKRVNLLEVIQLDMDLTMSYLLYTQHLFNGRVNPSDLGGTWHNESKRNELAQYMSGKGVKEVLTMVEPKVKEYNELQQQLTTYRSIAESGGWPMMPENTFLKQGDEGEFVYTLRRRLDKTGDMTRSLSKSSGNSYYFGEELAAAVRNFQRRHGIKPDGIVNQETVRELNRSASERVEQIKVNLERIRWMPRELGDNYILINVPGFTLSYINGGRVAEKMKVIVGSSFSATPIVHANLSYIMFSPSWTVPGPVFIRQILPQVKEDPEFLEKNGYVLYGTVSDVGEKEMDPEQVNWNTFVEDYPHFKVVQKPGPGNEQGRIKFVMPNNYNIFLSDAASENMFAETKRDFNYRCISVEKPVQLAATLLNSRKWKSDDIEKSMQQKVPVKASLPQPVPVYITYRTCWVDENGELNFSPDIYGFDEAQYQFTRPESSFEEEF